MSTVSEFKSFHYLESGEVTYSTLDTIKSKKTLDSGCYVLQYLDYPHNMVRVTIDRDIETSKIHNFPHKEKMDKLFEKFFDKKLHKRISDMGFCHKTGVLLHGKEGTGKSTIMKHYYTNSVINNKALVFFVNELDYRLQHCWEFIVNVRQIQKNPIIVVFDEFDRQFSKNEGYIKTMMDGNLSIDNCIFFASTNYLDKIPKAVRDRESRFKYSFEIKGIPSKEHVLEIIEKLIGTQFDEEHLDKFAEKLKGKTLDKIKQFCMNKIMNLEEYIAEKKKIGF